MDNNESGYACIRQHTVCAACTIFDGTDVPFNVRYMFPSSTGVEAWEPRSDRLKFIISKDGTDFEATMLVSINNRLYFGDDG